MFFHLLIQTELVHKNNLDYQYERSTHKPQMSTKDFTVKSYDNLKLCCRTWYPPTDTPTKARILFIHGFSEFLDAYKDWFPLVTKAGYEVTMYDQRGHGNTAKSKKDLGVSHEEGVMGDLETMVSHVSEGYEGPLILWGFSMGGATCLNYMVIGQKKERIDLYISVGPFIRSHPDTAKGLNGLKLKIIPYVVKFWPSYKDKADLKPEDTTNNPEKWESYRKEPLRHLQSTALFMHDALARGERLLDPQFIAQIADRPLLLCHGESDNVCDVECSKEFIKIARLSDKTLDLYPGLPHEIMQCVDKDRFDHWQKVQTWLDSHVEKLPNKV